MIYSIGIYCKIMTGLYYAIMGHIGLYYYDKWQGMAWFIKVGPCQLVLFTFNLIEAKE